MTRNFYLVVCLIAIFGRRQRCDTTQIHSAASAMEAAVWDLFPGNIEINEGCVIEGCPALMNFSLCPSDLKVDALTNMTKIMSDCMKSCMCGIVADARPIKPLVVSMDELLPGLKLQGICTLLPDTNFLSNVSNMQLEKSANENQHLPLQMTVVIPNLRLHGRGQLDFRLETVFGPALTASLTQASYDIEIQFISTISVNQTLNRAQYDVKIVNAIVNARPLLCGIDMPSGFPDIQSLFTSTAQIVVESSSLAKVLGKYLGRLYRSAIQVVSNNCQLSNATV